MPDWTERHVPDIGVMLTEILAYTGDYLSYYQDAVATEAYLNSARQRISVRRHARLVDYFLHEGCNARAWVCVEVDTDLSLEASKLSFITSMSDVRVQTENTLTWEDLQDVPDESYEVFEPLVTDRSAPIELLQAHNKIKFYTFGEARCCLETGSASATLLDTWVKTKVKQNKNQAAQSSKEQGLYKEGGRPEEAKGARAQTETGRRADI